MLKLTRVRPLSMIDHLAKLKYEKVVSRNNKERKVAQSACAME